MKHKNMGLLALAVVLVLSLSACGGNKNNTAAGSAVSPAPSAETTIIPTAEPTPGSVTEKDTNAGDVTNPDNSVAPGDHNGSAYDSAKENGSTRENGSVTDNGSAAENGKARTVPENGVNGNHSSAYDNNGSNHEGSTVGEDLKRAGEDLGDAARDTAHSVEDGVNNMGR